MGRSTEPTFTGRNGAGRLLGSSWARSWDALEVFLNLWGAIGALRSNVTAARQVTAAPACYKTLFSYIVFQAGLLHAAFGSLLRLSSSLSSLSCLLDSPLWAFLSDSASYFN